MPCCLATTPAPGLGECLLETPVCQQPAGSSAEIGKLQPLRRDELCNGVRQRPRVGTARTRQPGWSSAHSPRCARVHISCLAAYENARIGDALTTTEIRMLTLANHRPVPNSLVERCRCRAQLPVGPIASESRDAETRNPNLTTFVTDAQLNRSPCTRPSGSTRSLPNTGPLPTCLRRPPRLPPPPVRPPICLDPPPSPPRACMLPARPPPGISLHIVEK